MRSRLFTDRFTAFFLIVVTTGFLVSVAQGATLVVANNAEASVSLIDLTSGDVVATLPTDNGPHEDLQFDYKEKINNLAL